MTQIILFGGLHTVNQLLDGFTIKETPSSNNVKVIAVKPKSHELFVQFRRGDSESYLYTDVPDEIMHRALTAESIGKFHHAEIKDKFEFTKITDPIFVKVEKD